jgi:tRNA (guanine-N7-)-methyltransferase
LGIEVAIKYARYAAARLARGNLPNASLIHGDAQRLFQEVLSDNSLIAVHVYFPDPWWKKRHFKRRVLNTSFVQNVERKLRRGGSFHYWTDVKKRFDETLDLIRTATTLGPPLEVAERSAEHTLDFRTYFERRTRLSGLPVYRAEFRKR